MLETRPSEASDPLSDALTRIRLRAFTNVALDAAKEWAIDFPAYEGFTFNVVQRGECWISVKGDPQVIRLNAGDCFLMTGGRQFSLASDLAIKKRLLAEELFSQSQDGHVSCNGGGDFFVAGTLFRFEGHLPSILFHRLPPIIHVDGSSDQAAVLRWNLDRFTAEMRSHSVGRKLILSHLAPIMLVQMLRFYLHSAPKGSNWLVALSHPRLSKALEAIQTDYQRDWSLDQLASLANMSRSGFALTFKRTVGISPMNYLMNWRMQIACELLQAGDESLDAVATAIGYRSESAFSTAFAKIVKCRPGGYRRTEPLPAQGEAARKVPNEPL